MHQVDPEPRSVNDGSDLASVWARDLIIEHSISGGVVVHGPVQAYFNANSPIWRKAIYLKMAQLMPEGQPLGISVRNISPGKCGVTFLMPGMEQEFLAGFYDSLRPPIWDKAESSAWARDDAEKVDPTKDMREMRDRMRKPYAFIDPLKESGKDPLEEAAKIADEMKSFYPQSFREYVNRALADMHVGLPGPAPKGTRLKVTSNSDGLFVNGHRLPNASSCEWISDGSRWVPVDPTEPTYRDDPPKRTWQIQPKPRSLWPHFFYPWLGLNILLTWMVHKSPEQTALIASRSLAKVGLNASPNGMLEPVILHSFSFAFAVLATWMFVAGNLLLKRKFLAWLASK